MIARIIFVASLIAAPHLAAALPPNCVDLDGDGYLGGIGCAEATDCADRSWQRHPGAVEICDGLDNDCDGSIDEICMASCPTPTRAPFRETFRVAPDLENWLVNVITTDIGSLIFAAVTPALPDIYLVAQARDHDNVPLGPWVPIGEPNAPNIYEDYPELASSGDRVIALYIDDSERTRALRRLKARVVDLFGHPVHDAPLDLTSTIVVGGGSIAAPWDFQGVTWDGEHFVAFWNYYGEREKLWMTKIRPDGTFPENPTQLVLQEVLGLQPEFHAIKVRWTGNSHLVLVNDVDFYGIAVSISERR